jgi:hypothetical protein
MFTKRHLPLVPALHTAPYMMHDGPDEYGGLT